MIVTDLALMRGTGLVLRKASHRQRVWLWRHLVGIYNVSCWDPGLHIPVGKLILASLFLPEGIVGEHCHPGGRPAVGRAYNRSGGN